MSNAAQRKEKLQWAIDKAKLDNARKLRGISFIDPDDGVQGNRSKNAWKTLEIPIEAAVPCKLRTTKRPSKMLETDSDTRGSNNIPKTKHANIVEAHESTRMRLEFTLPKDHEDHIAEKGFNSLSHYNLVHKLVLMLQAMKILDAKPAVDKEWEKLEKLLAWQLTKVGNKKVATSTKKSSRKKTQLEPKYQKYKGRAVLRGDRLQCCIHRARFICVTIDGRNSNGCHCKTTRLCKASSRRSIRSLSSKNGGRSIIAQNSKVRMFLHMSTT